MSETRLCEREYRISTDGLGWVEEGGAQPRLNSDVMFVDQGKSNVMCWCLRSTTPLATACVFSCMEGEHAMYQNLRVALGKKCVDIWYATLPSQLFEEGCY